MSGPRASSAAKSPPTPPRISRYENGGIAPSADAVIRLAELGPHGTSSSLADMPRATPPARQIRAAYDDRNITVYQAYSPAIAEPALTAGRFVPPFKLGRMTWIKPSFLWMMYRSGWGAKPGQECILAIQVTRDGFERALAQAALSHYEPAVYADHSEWAKRKETAPVRIQWDPDRSLTLAPLSRRAIQIGLSGEAARNYVQDWIVDIAQITGLAHEIRGLVAAGNLSAAKAKLPAERPYPLPDSLRAAIGAS